MSWEKWNKAIPLQKAPLHFGNEEDVARYKEFHKQHNGMKMLDALLTNIENDAKGTDIFEGVIGEKTPKHEIMASLRNDTKERLLSGELNALGFQAPRNVSDTPAPIPSDLWLGRIYWEKDCLTSGTIKLEGLRIEEESIALSPLPGRPSRQEQIAEAFQTLVALDQIDFRQPKKNCYEAVKNWVLTNYPDEENGEKGLSIKALEKHVNPLFDKAKDTSL